MQDRTFLALVLASLAIASSGCCCFPGNCGPGGEYGGGCCFCLPRPIVWTGECNECGPGGCASCADCCGDCGILALMRRGLTCGKGCGEIYMGEWISDPPDCCDPCDRCHGCWTGPQGACHLGPFQRLLAACHGYSYCPKPCCGPACGGLCNRGSCGPVCGCGGAGCAGCDGGPHGAVLSEGVSYGPAHTIETLPPPAGVKLAPTHAEPQHSILEENWNIPRSRPVPGKPIHKAQQPTRAQTTGHRPAAIGAGVRQANYLR
jgi:hypothetical protein